MLLCGYNIRIDSGRLTSDNQIILVGENESHVYK